MNSLEYRKKRIKLLIDTWDAERVNDYMVRKKINKKMFLNFKFALINYISKALGIDFSLDDKTFIHNVNEARDNKTNFTPNGAVVPKSEYTLEYNIFLREWCNIVRNLSLNNPKLLNKFRITPNVRIKFGNELVENINRGLSTSLPHSDSWVEGPWGMNCHIPVLGDCKNNYLHFYKLKEESMFEDNFLKTSETYTDMQWVTPHYEDDNIIPEQGYIHISDYVLLHNTKRNKNAGTRISIDSTILAGNHDVHPSREKEYTNKIPDIGENLFVKCLKSEKDNYEEKDSVFSHYAIKSMEHISL